jgi:molybdenum cofactor biosynthesis protein B
LRLFGGRNPLSQPEDDERDQHKRVAHPGIIRQARAIEAAARTAGRLRFLVPGPWSRSLFYDPLVSQHAHKAEGPRQVRVAVLTISDTRTDASDTSGRAIVDLLQADGHHVVARAIVRDDPGEVTTFVDAQLAGEAQVVITTGGTGITSRDSTFEAIDARLEKRLDGFGELFRMLSYTDIGPAAMLSRACAGLVRGRVVVALPGSEGAVRLAMTRLLLPELGHLVQQASK